MAEKTVRRSSRQRTRELDVEIGFLEGLVRRDPQYREALELLGDDYSERGRHRESLGVDERLKTLTPDDPNVRFNLACSLALNRKFEPAAGELVAALELGFRDLRALSRDPDLAALRRHPAYRPVRARVRALKATTTR
jgi:tetratricopeptide (TPR) repeat protein